MLNKKFGLLVLVAIGVMLYFLFSKRECIDAASVPFNDIEDFDVILSQGQSVESKIIRLLNFSPGKSFSHAGIIFKENGVMRVLHATPDGTKENCLRYDDLQTFFNLSDACDYAILRCRNMTEAQRGKLLTSFMRYRNEQHSFDYHFDNSEHNFIYCSELIWLIFNKAGILNNIDFDLSKPIAPLDFLSCEKFRQIPLAKS